jgi:hypothetical protein
MFKTTATQPFINSSSGTLTSQQFNFSNFRRTGISPFWFLLTFFPTAVLLDGLRVDEAADKAVTGFNVP